jgi:site-specific DNA-methyltransferase (adenine-specific)
MTIRTHISTGRASSGPNDLTPKVAAAKELRAPGRLLVGDARDHLKQLESNSIDCVITSPPYFRLRNYQHEAQIGLEAHVDMWVEELRLLLREVRRVLKPSGSLWLNLGDSYSRSDSFGAPNKSLLLAPERLALALVSDGWILRSKVIWAKTNPVPSSAQDRLSCTHEVVYFLTKSPKYFFDLDAVREVPRSAMRGLPADALARQRYMTARTLSNRPTRPAQPLQPPQPKLPRQSIEATETTYPTKTTETAETAKEVEAWRGPLANTNSGLKAFRPNGLGAHALGKNPGDVWSLATSSFRSEHHATFPAQLVERPLKATCPKKVCVRCLEPWTRTRARSVGHLAVARELQAECRCGAGAKPGVVLDPFLGSGTTAVVAEQLGRDWVGIEVSPVFADIAWSRIARAIELIQMARISEKREAA